MAAKQSKLWNCVIQLLRGFFNKIDGGLECTSSQKKFSPVNFRYYLIPADCCNSYCHDLDIKILFSTHGIRNGDVEKQVHTKRNVKNQ